MQKGVFLLFICSLCPIEKTFYLSLFVLCIPIGKGMFLVLACSLCPRHFTCVYLFFVSHVERQVSCVYLFFVPHWYIHFSCIYLFFVPPIGIGKGIHLGQMYLYCRMLMFHAYVIMYMLSQILSLLQYHMITKIWSKLARYIGPRLLSWSILGSWSYHQGQELDL